MKREFLEGLGLDSEKVDAIMKEHGVSISKLNTDLTNSKNEVLSLKTQIEDANEEIQSYKDMDIDSIKKSASEWETKYKDLVKEQEDAKKESIRDERTKTFFNDVKFASESAKAGVIAEFNKKEFKFDEETNKFLGATEWLEDLKQKDTGAFLSEVANPKFTTTPTAPTADGSMDDILESMGLSENKN